MKTEKSCGAVVFTRDSGGVEYVIIESKNSCFGFPKGRVERGENERETARREILEETGLAVDIIDGFREESTYSFSCNGEVINKKVVYFLAEYSFQVPKAQETELNAVYLMKYEDADMSVRFNDIKRILSSANSFIANLPKA